MDTIYACKYFLQLSAGVDLINIKFDSWQLDLKLRCLILYPSKHCLRHHNLDQQHWEERHLWRPADVTDPHIDMQVVTKLSGQMLCWVSRLHHTRLPVPRQLDILPLKQRSPVAHLAPSISDLKRISMLYRDINGCLKWSHSGSNCSRQPFVQQLLCNHGLWQ